MCCGRCRPSACSAARAASSAQPTTQGVSLRGIGPSGQSRTLVLLDGVPFNDPFGGWVYWTRVPLVSVDRIEITEDTASSLYGNYAMGGVINIVTSRPTRRTLELKPQYGNRDSSPKFDFFASDSWNKVGAAVEGSFFNTDGFPIVAPTERGPIDNNANVEYRTSPPSSSTRRPIASARSVRAGYFTENRNNGKVGELNDTRWTTRERRRPHAAAGRQRPAGARVRRRPARALQLPGGDQRRRRRATSSASRPISTCRPTASAAWRSGRRRSARSNVFSAGADWRWVDGDSQEDAYVASRCPTVDRRRDAGGDAVGAARLGRHAAEPGRVRAGHLSRRCDKLVVTLSARVDHWRNYDGHNLETTVRDRPADGQQPAVAARHGPTPSSARASPRCTT